MHNNLWMPQEGPEEISLEDTRIQPLPRRGWVASGALAMVTAVAGGVAAIVLTASAMKAPHSNAAPVATVPSTTVFTSTATHPSVSQTTKTSVPVQTSTTHYVSAPRTVPVAPKTSVSRKPTPSATTTTPVPVALPSFLPLPSSGPGDSPSGTPTPVPTPTPTHASSSSSTTTQGGSASPGNTPTP